MGITYGVTIFKENTMPMSVYSMKINPEYLEGAKKFFLRVNLSLQETLRAQMKMASDCENCLALVEANAPVGQIQSAFASILTNAKETWHLNGLFRDAIVKTASAAGLPDDFIANVLSEAQRIQNSSAGKDKKQ